MSQPHLPRPSRPRWHARFLAMLPSVESRLRYAFCRLPADAREEAIQEALVNVLIAFRRLVQQGRSDRAFPSVLARFAVAQVRCGRQVATPLNVQETLSPYSQRRKGYVVERLDRFDPVEEKWVEAVVEDPRTPVIDQVCFRIDFPEWLRQLPPRRRRITLALAAGQSTSAAARRFRLSPARISQLRGELRDSWREFQGDLSSGARDTAPVACTSPA